MCRGARIQVAAAQCFAGCYERAGADDDRRDRQDRKRTICRLDEEEGYEKWIKDPKFSNNISRVSPQKLRILSEFLLI